MKKFWVFGMAVALLAPMAVLSAGPVGAAGGTTCATQTGGATFSPGITSTPHNVKITVSEKLTGCKGGGVVSGVESASFTDKGADCAGLSKVGTKTGPFIGTIKWTSPTVALVSSTVSLTTVTPVLLEATATGSVKAGTFKGGAISTEIKYALSKGNCVKTPLTALTLKGIKPFKIS